MPLLGHQPLGLQAAGIAIPSIANSTPRLFCNVGISFQDLLLTGYTGRYPNMLRTSTVLSSKSKSLRATLTPIDINTVEEDGDAQVNTSEVPRPVSCLTAGPNPFEPHTMDYIMRLDKRGRRL